MLVGGKIGMLVGGVVGMLVVEWLEFWLGE